MTTNSSLLTWLKNRPREMGLAGWTPARRRALWGRLWPSAAEWGLIWRCVDDDRLMDETRALAAHLATQPTRALAMIKQAFNAAAGNSLDRQLDLERDLQRLAGRSEDYREGVAAFLEKRPAKFVGR